MQLILTELPKKKIKIIINSKIVIIPVFFSSIIKKTTKKIASEVADTIWNEISGKKVVTDRKKKKIKKIVRIVKPIRSLGTPGI